MVKQWKCLSESGRERERERERVNNTLSMLVPRGELMGEMKVEDNFRYTGVLIPVVVVVVGDSPNEGQIQLACFTPVVVVVVASRQWV